MSPQLPPPDPHETLGPAGDFRVSAPTAILLGDAAQSEAADRLSDSLLDLRPGLLIIFAGA